ncbi:MAG: nitroreductase family protein [Candidatus Omnitrophota bacterium]|jgi:nitroreductase
MDIITALKERRSVRGFTQKPIPSDLIEKVIDCGRFAPTARNIQPWEFVVVTDKKSLGEIASLAENGPFIKNCACCVAVFCQETKYYLEDGCAATVNIMTAAHALGIGSCWVAGDKKPYADKIAGILKVPAGFKLASLIALGYPAEEPSLPSKKPLKDIIHWENF